MLTMSVFWFLFVCYNNYVSRILMPCDYATIGVQWNLFIMDTLGPAISGSFLLLYRGLDLAEGKRD